MGIFNWYHHVPQEAGKKRKVPGVRPAAGASNFTTGGLPDAAIQRLRNQETKQGTAEHLWTGNLSVNELLLTRQCGFVPLGQVMGTSIYRIGMQWRTGAWRNDFWKGEGAGYELDVLTQGFLKARSLALGRLQQEAELLGATGVIGVQIQQRKTEWQNGLFEFSAVGTAIREAHLTQAQHPSANKPPLFLSELSGQEYWQLRQAGFRPRGIAVGYCVYCQISNFNTQNTVGGGLFNANNWRNAELSDFTEGLYTARSLAMRRMEQDALGVKATGIVSVDAKTEIEVEQAESSPNPDPNYKGNIDYPNQKMIYRFSAIGTAIESFPICEDQSLPQIVVSLDSKVKHQVTPS